MNNFVVITGSAGGVGRALVQEYLDAGYIVLGLDLNASEKDRVNRFYGIECDLQTLCSDEAALAALRKRLMSVLDNAEGRVVLINNAAKQIVAPLASLSAADMRTSFEINSIAPALMLQTLLPTMRSLGGSVLNICSIHARLTKPDFSAYAASKAALESLTRSWALELAGQGIPVNAISPAAIGTSMLMAGFSDNPELLEALSQYHPAQKIGKPAALAKLARRITELDDTFLSGCVIDYSGAISSRLHDPV